MKKWIFSTSAFLPDLALAILRISAGLMMLTHGWPKIFEYSTRLERFADPVGLSPEISLQLTIFAEFFCSIFLIMGFMTRFSLIPLIIAMAVAGFIVHGDDPFQVQEKAFLFLTIFISLFILGPGKFSVDAQIEKNSHY